MAESYTADPFITYRYPDGRVVHAQCSSAHRFIFTGAATPHDEKDAETYEAWVDGNGAAGGGDDQEPAGEADATEVVDNDEDGTDEDAGSDTGPAAPELDAMTKPELEALAAARGVEVRRADGKDAAPLKSDYIRALTAPIQT